MKHKHAEFIKLWADGEEIECKKQYCGWHEIKNPAWDINTEYRVKPKPDKEFFAVAFVCQSGELFISSKTKMPNVKFTFNGGTGEFLSAEKI